MTVIGFHCSHEQIDPAQLLRDVQQAEQAGFTAGMSSDHFSPWSNDRVSQASRGLSSGPRWPRRTAFRRRQRARPALPPSDHRPGDRHPRADVPGRFWAALGSGEATNERVTGEDGPARSARSAPRRVRDVIRRLLQAKRSTTTASSTSTGPACGHCPRRPDLVGPAVTPETATRTPRGRTA